MNDRRILIAELPGGFGNQFFVFVAGYFFAKKTNRELVLDLTYVSHQHSKFDLEQLGLPHKIVRRRKNRFTKIIKKIKDSINFQVKQLGSFAYLGQEVFDDLYSFVEEDILNSDKRKIILRGFFHTFKYYGYSKEIIFEILEKVYRDRAIDLEYETIRKDSEIVIGVHVRRGDYLAEKHTLGVLSETYYLDILNKIESELIDKSYCLVFFTDDRKFCENLISNKEFKSDVVIRESHIDTDPLIDLILMTKCDKLFLSNSTFSLVAGLYASGLVIAPLPLRIKSRNHENLDSDLPIQWTFMNAIWDSD
jgi:hypothetical protein